MTCQVHCGTAHAGIGRLTVCSLRMVTSFHMTMDDPLSSL